MLSCGIQVLMQTRMEEKGENFVYAKKKIQWRIQHVKELYEREKMKNHGAVCAIVKVCTPLVHFARCCANDMK